MPVSEVSDVMPVQKQGVVQLSTHTEVVRIWVYQGEIPKKKKEV